MKGNIEVAITKVATKAVKYAATTATVAEKRAMRDILVNAAHDIQDELEADRAALMNVDGVFERRTEA